MLGQSLNIKQWVLQICLSASWGGLEMVAYEIAEELNRHKTPAETWTMKGGGLDQALTASKIYDKTFDKEKFSSFEFIIELRKNVRMRISHGYEPVILVQQLRDLKWIYWALLGIDNVKVVGMSHTFVNVSKKDWVHQLTYAKLDKLITLTDLQKENVAKYLPVESDRIVVIPNAVDTKKFMPGPRSGLIRDKIKASEKDFVVGLVGRLDPQKGQLTLLEALKILKEKGHLHTWDSGRLMIAFVGEDTRNTQGTREVLREKIQEYGLQDHAYLVGFIQDNPRVMRDLDLLVLASTAETFGRVIIEAMASRVPVIATRAGGVPDIISSGKNGILVEPNDEQGLSYALETLWKDKNLRQSLAESGYQDALQKYSTQKLYPEIFSALSIEMADAEPEEHVIPKKLLKA